MRIQKQMIEEATEETAAHDLLIVLLEKEGSKTVLATLRAWLVLLQLNGNRGAAGHKRQGAKNAFSTD